MRKITVLIAALFLANATTVQAQSQGGRGGGRHGGEGDVRPTSPPPRQTPLNQIMIVGVIRALDASAERVTIAYDPVDQLNWPAGEMPFAAGKPGLLADLKVGQKVRFRLESQRIVEISLFDAARAEAPGEDTHQHANQP